MMPSIGRLKIVPIRKVFEVEARDFTPWLEANIEALADRLGITLTVDQREKKVGAFNVDLWCSDAAGRQVIIENQLAQTDHSHLGQLLTYLVNLDASTAIWVTTDPRPEHTKVINWLNESTPADVLFYLVKVEAVQIEGASAYAPLFTVLAAPNAQAKETGEAKKDWADQHYHREAFWKSLLERSKGRTKLFSGIQKPGKESWIQTSTGTGGAYYQYNIRMNDASVNLYIDRGSGEADKNKRIFDALLADKDGIERDFGGALEWDYQPNRQSQYVIKRFTSSGLTDDSVWPVLQDEMIDAMIRFDKTLRPRLAKISV